VLRPLKLVAILAILLLSSMAALAQSTTVTGTVADQVSGQPYAGGTGQAIFVPGAGGQLSLEGGTSTFQQIVPITSMTAAGTFSVVVTDNTQIQPSGSQWKFTFCDSTRAFCFTTAAITISGASQSITSNINSVVLPLPRRPQTVQYVTADVSNSTVTPAAITGLSFPVAANQNYTLECNLIYQAASTGGLVVSFTGPASPTQVSYSLNEGLSATTSGFSATTGTTFATTLGGVVTTAATNFPAYLEMALENGATAGTVQVMFQSAAAVATTVKRGSYCTLQ
jgi:hypothetical protein